MLWYQLESCDGRMVKVESQVSIYKPIEEAVCSVKDQITKFMGIREKPSKIKVVAAMPIALKLSSSSVRFPCELHIGHLNERILNKNMNLRSVWFMT